MDRKEMTAMLAALVTTLADMPDNWSPRTPVYLALGMDIDKYTAFESAVSRAGLVTVTNDTIKLTADGKALADKINAALAKHCSICNSAMVSGNCPSCDRPQ